MDPLCTLPPMVEPRAESWAVKNCAVSSSFSINHGFECAQVISSIINQLCQIGIVKILFSIMFKAIAWHFCVQLMKLIPFVFLEFLFR